MRPTNPLRSVSYLILMAALPMVALAQDGWLFSATPPIVVRYDGECCFHFTNTSDAPIHGVTLHNGEKSRVIIDTIGPHKTALVDLGAIPSGLVVNGGTITCTNYSKPLKVNLRSGG